MAAICILGFHDENDFLKFNYFSFISNNISQAFTAVSTIQFHQCCSKGVIQIETVYGKQGRQTRQNLEGVAEVTKIDSITSINFIKRSNFHHFYAKQLKTVLCEQIQFFSKIRGGVEPPLQNLGKLRLPQLNSPSLHPPPPILHL